MSGRNELPPQFILEVEGMMCQKNCAATVQRALKTVDNVDDAVVTYATKEALIWGMGVVFEDLIDAIEIVGYDAKIKLHPGSRSNDSGEGNDPPDVTLIIKGMFDADSCPKKVETTLLAVDGVISTTVDFDRKLAFIWGFADYEALVSALSSAGFVGVDSTLAGALKSVDNQVSNENSSEIVFRLDKLLKISHNAADVERTLKNITGVDFVILDPESSSAIVTYDSSLISIEKMKQTLIDLQYYSAVTSSIPSLDGNISSASRELLFEVTGMSCANCALKIEKYLASAKGVINCGVSCMTNKARVVIDERVNGGVGPRDLMEKIQGMGYGCELVDTSKESTSGDKNNSASSEEYYIWLKLLVISLVLGIPVTCFHLAMSASDEVEMMSMQPAVCDKGVTWGQLIMMCLNVPILFLVGYRYYKAALLGLLHGNYGMDCLVVTGTSITFLYSCVQITAACRSGVPAKHVFFETTGMLLMFVTIGKFIEAFAKGKSVSAITNLLKLQPREALLVVQKSTSAASLTTRSADALQQTQEVLKTIHLDLVQRGDLIKVLPGSSIPTDGTVESGSSYVDQSMITGESIAVQKSAGDSVFGSTVNQNGCMYVRVTSLGSESALAQIVRLVEEAQMSKAPVQAYADTIAGFFTPFILLTAGVTFTGWYLFCRAGLVPTSWYLAEYGDPLLFSMLFAISVVVISCPCALGLATPTAIMVGSFVGSANGILIKSGSAFEMAHKINTVIFDKTGTLTEGKPTVTDEILIGDAQKVIREIASRINHTVVREAASRINHTTPPFHSDQHDKNTLLQIAATAEQASEHPLARAVIYSALHRNLHLQKLKENAAKSHVGSGVACECEIIGSILVGNRGFMEENSIPVVSTVDSAMWDLEVQGKTAVCVAVDGKILGLLGIADIAKTEAQSTIRALRGLGVDVWMLTGDSRTTAEALADQFDIPKERVMAGVLPKDKVSKVSELQALGQFVAMVGDGVNDSPALAQSDLGVAIGAGTQVAIEAADMVLVRNNLHDLVVALDLAKVVFSRIKWNFMWAVLYNLVAVPYAAGIWFPFTKLMLPPQYAALAMALSSVSVVISSSALWLYKRPAYLTDDLALSKVLSGGILEKAKRRFNSLKENIQDSITSGKTRRGSAGSVQYQKLARDESEAELGLELGIGGMGGLRSSSSNSGDKSHLLGGLDDELSDGIV